MTFARFVFLAFQLARRSIHKHTGTNSFQLPKTQWITSWNTRFIHHNTVWCNYYTQISLKSEVAWFHNHTWQNDSDSEYRSNNITTTDDMRTFGFFFDCDILQTQIVKKKLCWVKNLYLLINLTYLVINFIAFTFSFRYSTEAKNRLALFVVFTLQLLLETKFKT